MNENQENPFDSVNKKTYENEPYRPTYKERMKFRYGKYWWISPVVGVIALVVVVVFTISRFL